MDGCSSSNLGLLMKFIWEIQAWVSFSKPPGNSRVQPELRTMSEGRDEACTVHPGVLGCDWVSLPPPPPQGWLPGRPGWMFPALSLPLCPSTQVFRLTQTCTCAHVHTHSSAFYHPLVTSYFNSRLSSLAKLWWSQKPARNQRKTKRMSKGVVQLPL